MALESSNGKKVSNLISKEIIAMPDCESTLTIAEKLIEAGDFEYDRAIEAYQVKDRYLDLKVKSLENIFESNSSTIVGLKKYRGEGIAKIWIVNRIKQLARFFKVTHGIEEELLGMTADLILADYYYFTILDFKLFSQMAIKGDFGTAYNRFDIPVLLEWMKEYREIRMTGAATNSQLKGKEEIISKDSISMPKYLKKMINKSEEKEKKSIPKFKEVIGEYKEMWKTEYDYAVKVEKENGITKTKELGFNNYSALRYQNLIKLMKK